MKTYNKEDVAVTIVTLLGCAGLIGVIGALVMTQ